MRTACCHGRQALSFSFSLALSPSRARTRSRQSPPSCVVRLACAGKHAEVGRRGDPERGSHLSGTSNHAASAFLRARGIVHVCAGPGTRTRSVRKVVQTHTHAHAGCSEGGGSALGYIQTPARTGGDAAVGSPEQSTFYLTRPREEAANPPPVPIRTGEPLVRLPPLSRVGEERNPQAARGRYQHFPLSGAGPTSPVNQPTMGGAPWSAYTHGGRAGRFRLAGGPS